MPLYATPFSLLPYCRRRFVADAFAAALRHAFDDDAARVRRAAFIYSV